ncbi:MAG: hypothetical protein MJ182_00855 [Treponema sp.]|nr:hypothetical protein [Treponema sp.]
MSLVVTDNISKILLKYNPSHYFGLTPLSSASGGTEILVQYAMEMYLKEKNIPADILYRKTELLKQSRQTDVYHDLKLVVIKYMQNNLEISMRTYNVLENSKSLLDKTMEESLKNLATTPAELFDFREYEALINNPEEQESYLKTYCENINTRG